MHFGSAQCKQKGFAPILILVGILVLVAVAGGAYFLGKQTAVPQPSPTPAASPAPTGAGETANWKTYTNTTYGYSIKFPDAYEVPLQTERQKGQLGVDSNMCVVLKKTSRCYLVIDYWQKSFDEVIKMKLPTDGSQPQDYTVGTIKGKRVVYKIGESTTQVITILPKPNVTNETITLSYTVVPGDVETPKVMDQILSTFKFTN